MLEAAARFPADPRPEDWAGREDLRERTIITIDGESARDFDDAVSIERLPDGVFRLGVHIADVSHYVKEGTRWTSRPTGAAPASTIPSGPSPCSPRGCRTASARCARDVPRLTLSAFLDIDRDGVIQARRFAETVIRSARRMTYNEVRRILEEPRAEDAAEYGAGAAGAARDART